MKQPTYPIPKGAKPYTVIIDPDPTTAMMQGFSAWQQQVIEELKPKGVIIVEIEGGNIFHGYYFPARTNARRSPR
jgi:hypothetical protein